MRWRKPKPAGHAIVSITCPTGAGVPGHWPATAPLTISSGLCANWLMYSAW